MKILFIGDIFGEPGRRMVVESLRGIRRQHGIGFVVANGENSAGGMGITPVIAGELFSAGVDVITSGNHIWKYKEIFEFLKTEPRLLRPLNYPADVPGSGSTVAEAGGIKIGVINVMGRTFMDAIECPFRTSMEEAKKLSEQARIILVDFHAEATSEKVALGWFLDGTVSAVVGTHTHVQTADERVLPGGTAYITDAGMTGSRDSVIGVKKEIIIRRFLAQVPVSFEVAKGDEVMSAVIIETDEQTGRSSSIQRLQAGVKMNGEG